MADIFYDSVIDTAIIVDALMGRKEAIAELQRQAKPCISRVTWLEVMSGAPNEGRMETEAFLAGFPIREVTGDVARRAAELQQSRPGMTQADALVFATAQDSGAILVTRNTKDFPAQTPGIRVPYEL